MLNSPHLQSKSPVLPDLAIQQLNTGSLYGLLHDQYEIVVDHASQEISATVVDEEKADLLQIPAFSPALLAQRTVYDEQGRIIELARGLYRADRYRFNLMVQRNGTRLASVYE
ncbi:GntR family transcriptional regulator [Microbulbifer sp. YPW16]|uniref:GntR family transcriptional regulator n=1 Tax=Microbulbifer sp. YPW16 TaxID=2904242 RepID=UPI00351CD1F4